MYNTFTKKERSEIEKTFGHWDDEKNAEWVLTDFAKRRHLNDSFVNNRINELVECGLIKSHSEKIYVYIKLEEFWKVLNEVSNLELSTYIKYKDKLKSLTEEMNIITTLPYYKKFTNDYTSNRCKGMKFETLQDEVNYKIIIGQIPTHMNSYVESRLDEFSFDGMDPEEEVDQIVKLGQCEEYTNDFIEERVKFWRKRKYYSTPKEEVSVRIELLTTELFVTSYIDNRCKDLFIKTPDQETEVRKILQEHEVHSNDYVEKRIKEYDFDHTSSDKLVSELKRENEIRIDLEECGIYVTPEINRKYDFWINNGHVVSNLSDEIKTRYLIRDCLKFDTDYINRETNRLIGEQLIRSPAEEYKTRINLGYYEDNVKDKEKIANKDAFWDLISVDGLENQALLRDELNEVGKGFCLAKWNQVSILLQTGQTHSCHHPRPHVVPLSELENNPSALHNTKFKKEQRKTMLEGGRPEECDYCWNVEDANPDAFSDRTMKSGEGWAFPYYDKIKKSDPDENTNPTYVEVSFSNQCNMSCGYCDVKSSSNWQHEIKTKGPYLTSGMFNNTEWMEREGIVPIPHTKPNPYRDAFWKWWPDMFPGLHTFRITGGEPLLHKDTFKVLDYLIENPKVNPRLEMSVNSNLCAPQDLFEEFVDKVKYITDNDLVWNFTLFTSIESWGKQAEYMRDGMDTERFWNNLDIFLTKCQKPEATIMSTYNLTSVPSYHEVIKKVFDLKKKHYNGKRYRHYAVILDTSYLRHPEFLQIRLLSTYWIDKIREDVKLMESLSEEKYTYIYGHGHGGFYDFEREKLRRVLDWVDAPLDDIKWLMKMRRDFALYIDEFDKRRGKNFLETFPEMEDFYNSCKKLV
jgi:organic radical activating enzyme